MKSFYIIFFIYITYVTYLCNGGYTDSYLHYLFSKYRYELIEQTAVIKKDMTTNQYHLDNNIMSYEVMYMLVREDKPTSILEIGKKE